MSRTVEVDEDIERLRVQKLRLRCLEMALSYRADTVTPTSSEAVAIAARYWRFVDTGEVSDADA